MRYFWFYVYACALPFLSNTQGELSPVDQIKIHLPAPPSIDKLPSVKRADPHCTPNPVEKNHIVHWTHVPKAGGTTFSELTKQAACIMNPHLSEFNPCCRKKLCLAPQQSCHSSASSCPLVTGIGRHSSNMDRLLGVPCCGTGWSMISSVVGFLPYALKQDNNIKEPQYELWPFEDRVRFLKQVGVPDETIKSRLKGMRPRLSKERLQNLTYLAGTITSPFESRKELSKHINRCTRDMMNGRCCGKTPGSNSLTMLRHPYMRGISGFFYRGHSPNYDVYSLRPGHFTNPRLGSRNTQHPKRWTFQEFMQLPEYTNVITKMFGGSKNCDQVIRCHMTNWRKESLGGPCFLTTACHAYRNSTFLSQIHLTNAQKALDMHNYIGLVEAYNSSILLMASLYDLELKESDFKNARPSLRLESACEMIKVLKLKNNKQICLRYCQANSYDLRTYEHAHRSFCRRLKDAGLRDHPMVIKELNASKLCGDVDFGIPRFYCDHIHSEKNVKLIEKVEEQCRQSKMN